MNKFFLITLSTLTAMMAWVALVFVGGGEGWGKTAIASSNNAADYVQAAQQMVEARHTGNLSMLLLEEGDVAESYHFSIANPVDESSVFQVASLGKWITAWGVMVLVQNRQVYLDAPVSEYLTRWQLPPSEFDHSGVTIRRLLSHTAGLNDGLGYNGFDSAGEVQSLEESLTRALDASPGNSGIVKLGAEPGKEWNYSGGGYTVLQLLIEEVSKQSFPDFMSEHVFTPLGMERTTFKYDEALRLGLAQNFSLEGRTESFRFYSALAATSLFTSTEDLGRFIAAQTNPGRLSVLSADTLKLMRTPHASQLGADIWGLGPMLYAPNNQNDYIIGHDGNNGPAINTVARFDPDTGDGIVILSTGSDTLATRLAGEWVFWKTGNIDSLMFLMSFDTILFTMGIGLIVILVIGVIVGFRAGRARRN